MLNLVSNALKFTHTDGLITIKTRLINKSSKTPTELERYLCDEEMLEISVTDNGTGIKEQDM